MGVRGLLRFAVVAVCLVVWAVAVGGAGSAGLYSDAVNDTTGPDIGEVRILTGLDGMEVRARVVNRDVLREGETITIEVNIDPADMTGPDGSDLRIVFEGASRRFSVWNGERWVENTFPFQASFADGEARALFEFGWSGEDESGRREVFVGSRGSGAPDPAASDRAPDRGRWPYELEDQVLRRATLHARPRLPRAGQVFTIRSVTLTLTMETINTGWLTCSAQLPGRRLPVRKFESCSWRIPLSAAGKRLSVGLRADYVTYKSPVIRRAFRVRAP